MQITESKLKALIEEEIALMIENGEIDEGLLDRIGAGIGAMGTKAKAGLKSMGQQAAATALGARAKGAEMLGGDAAKLRTRQQTQKTQAQQTTQQAGAQAKAGMAKKILTGKLIKLSRLNTDLTNDVRKLGLEKEQGVAGSLKQLEDAISQMVDLLVGDEPAQPVAQQQAQPAAQQQAQPQMQQAAEGRRRVPAKKRK